MIFIYISLLFLLFIGCRFPSKCSNESYLSKDTTNTIKGLFIALVFISHIQGYIKSSGYEYEAFGDFAMRSIQDFMGQLIVVMFLFYSGYGIMESYKKKGATYVRTMPRKRLLTTLINFDIAVILFIVLQAILAKPLSFKQCALALVGWDSVGNSNWYIFVILLCYLIMFISLSVDKMVNRNFNNTTQYNALKKHLPASVFLLLSAISYIILYKTKQNWWYDTFFSFGAGALFSIYKEDIQKLIDRHYWIVLFTSAALFISIKYIPGFFMGLKHNIVSILFALTIVIITRKVNLQIQPLKWLGKHLFPLYIYQRIPMILFYEIDGGRFVSNHLYFYILICGIVTLVFGYVHHFFAVKLN